MEKREIIKTEIRKVKSKQLRTRVTVIEFLQMLAPVGALLLVIILHSVLPNIYPEGYRSTVYPAFLRLALAVYLVLLATACIFVRVRKKMVQRSWLVMAGILLLEGMDIATLKTAHFRLPFVPSPDKVLESVTANYERLAVNFYYSMKLLGTGVFIGIISGLTSGILIGWSKICHYWLMPVLKIIGPAPAAWLPIVMVLFPTSYQASIFIIVLSIWFPLTLMVSSAIRDTDKRLIESARVLGAGDFYIMFHVAVPAALPAMFNGLFMGLSASFGALIVAEMLGVKAGLGWYISWAQAWGEYGKLFSTVGIFIIIFFALIDLLFRIRRHLLKWQKGTVRW